MLKVLILKDSLDNKQTNEYWKPAECRHTLCCLVNSSSQLVCMSLVHIYILISN
jgi:hypothetical protein